jgi:DeoR/GlpR family transcriptional regulator of sugar metabolism
MGSARSTASARRQEILGLLLEQERVTVSELRQRFGVSTMTIHRDLDGLEERGVLRKVRGGATAQPTGLYESSLSFRSGQMRDAKEEIALLAVQQVEPGSSIALDDSTTALAMLPELAEIAGLTIVTNFISIVDAVAEMTDSDIRVIGVGGTYNPKYHAFGGVLAERALRELRVDRCFIAVAAVDPRRGAFHQEPDQAAIKRVMTEIATESTLLADHSKFDKQAVHRIVGFDAFSSVIVDSGTAPTTLAELREAGVEVQVAGARDDVGRSYGIGGSTAA